jgi:hypothetical protein
MNRFAFKLHELLIAAVVFVVKFEEFDQELLYVFFIEPFVEYVDEDEDATGCCK